MRRAIVKYHRDVGAQNSLNCHGFLRSQEKEGAVQVRAKLNSMLLDFADRRQAEHLEAAAVGQDGRGPINEPMQAAR